MSDIGVCPICSLYIPYDRLENHFREKHDLSPEQMHEDSQALLAIGKLNMARIFQKFMPEQVFTALPFLFNAFLKVGSENGQDREVLIHGLLELVQTLYEFEKAGK